MSNAPAREFGSTNLPVAALTPAKQLAIRLRCLACACITAAADEWRERAPRRREQRLAMSDNPFSRLSRGVIRVEARRLL